MSLHNLEAEQALLGAVLFDARLMGRISLAPDHFYDPTHGALWAEMLERYRADRLIDEMALKEWAAKAFKEVGGVKYLLSLSQSAAALTPQVLGYADMIRDLARRRAVVNAARDAIAAAEGAEQTAEVIQTQLEQRLIDLSVGDDDADDFKRMGESMAFAVESAELGEAVGISTGFKKLDEHIGGLKPALYLFGAASSMGKSTLLKAIATNIAVQDYAVVSFMLEMDETEDGLRSATALAFDLDHRADNPHYLSAQRNALTPAQKLKLRGATKGGAHLHVYTDYRPARTLSQIEAAARRQFAKLRRQGVRPGAVVIDHEGLIAPEKGSRFPSQLERTNARAEGLMALPKRLGVPVLVAGQLTKDGKRADGEERLPTMDDWKYGGGLIEAAHAVILVHRRAYYAERKPEHLRNEDDWRAIKSREAVLVLDKVRGGKRGQVTLLMDMPTAAVREVA